MFDLTRLRLFRDLAQRGTMTAVADSCGMTSSAVSQHLAILEREAGVRLLERIGRRVRLTPEGERLAKHAREIVRAVEEAELELRGACTAPAGRLSVASFATFAKTHLLPALLRIRPRCPGLEIDFHEMEPPEALGAIRDGRCHLAIVFEYNLVPRATDQNLLAQELCEQDVLLAYGSGTERRQSSLDLRDFADEDWMVGARQSDDRVLAERVCAAAGFQPRIVHAVDDYDLLIRMVADGFGVGLVPAPALSLSSCDDIGAGTPSGQTIVRRVRAVTRPGLAVSPSTRLLLSELRRVLPVLNRGSSAI